MIINCPKCKGDCLKIYVPVLYFGNLHIGYGCDDCGYCFTPETMKKNMKICPSNISVEYWKHVIGEAEKIMDKIEKEGWKKYDSRR